MSFTVYHWPYHLNFKQISVGYVALEVQSSIGRRYLSWFPEKSKSPENLIATKPHNHTRMEDIAEMGQAPDVINIDGLRDIAIFTFIDAARRHYSLFGTSCAQAVADALRAGIGGKYAAGIMNLNPIWTPQTVADFARRIRMKHRAF